MKFKCFEDIIAWQKAVDISERLKYLSNPEKEKLLEQANEISKIITGLIKSLKTSS